MIAIRIVAIVGVATALTFSTASAGPPAEPQASADAAAASSGFWKDWNEFKTSDGFNSLSKAAGCSDKTDAAVAEGKKARTQSIANIAVDQPKDVAKLLSDVAALPNGTENQGAVATVLAMRTTPKGREAAAPLVAPAAKAQVEEMTANLSSGIDGLPGIYLGDNVDRPAVPSGYAPVAGGSMGCPAR